MKERRLLVLSVDADRVVELRAALAKRSYLEILPEYDAQKHCSVCSRKKKPPTQSSVTHEMFEGLVRIAEKMAKTTTVCLITDEESRSKASPLEEERCVEFRADHLVMAEMMGLIDGYEDGSKKSYYLTEKCLGFLYGEQISPKGLLKVDGKIVGIDNGLTSKGQIHPGDRVAWDKLLTRAIAAVRSLPGGVREFIKRGQAPLLV